MKHLVVLDTSLSPRCPLTRATRTIVDVARLATMKSTAVLVNVSRGGPVDSYALSDARCERRLAGAALDVMATEPPEPDDPLLSAPNLILTNHLVWYSQASGTRLRRLQAERCAAVRTGSHTPSIVNADQLVAGPS